MSIDTTPTEKGFYWGIWRIKAQGTEDEQESCGGEWEVMHVAENCADETDPEHLMVMVPGVTKWQPLENFHWGNKVTREEKGPCCSWEKMAMAAVDTFKQERANWDRDKFNLERRLKEARALQKPVDAAFVDSVGAYLTYLEKSLNAGPMTNNPSREAFLITQVRKHHDAILAPAKPDEMIPPVGSLAYIGAPRKGKKP